MNIFKMIITYYMVVFIFVGVALGFGISISGAIYDINLVLKDKKQFVRCVFMYQFALYKLLKDEINKTGIIILEVITTLSVWFLNIFLCGIVACLWQIKMMCYLFWIIFRERGGKE